MKPTRLLILISLFIAIGIATTFLFYFFVVIDNIKTFPMHLEVSPDRYGMNADTDAIWFGKLVISNGASANRIIEIGNYKTHPTFVIVKLSGELGPWVKVNETNFVLEPNQTKELKFTVFPPLNTPPGNYTGEAKIIMKRYFN